MRQELKVLSSLHASRDKGSLVTLEYPDAPSLRNDLIDQIRPRTLAHYHGNKTNMDVISQCYQIPMSVGRYST